MPELPPQSRISSRIDGGYTTITIPSAASRSHGCLGGSWSAAAVLSFLCIVFFAQGIFSRNLGWTAVGVVAFILAAWQLLILRFFSPKGLDHTIQFEIGPEWLTEVAGSADAPFRQRWPRHSVAEIRVEQSPPALCIYFNDQQLTCRLLVGFDLAELNWIAEQIRLKWNMSNAAH